MPQFSVTASEQQVQNELPRSKLRGIRPTLLIENSSLTCKKDYQEPITA
jgi:hypothetical protein